MTFLELAKEIDAAKILLLERKAELDEATKTLAAYTQSHTFQVEALHDLMKEMQEMLGIAPKPSIADVDMKALALQGQQLRGITGVKK